MSALRNNRLGIAAGALLLVGIGVGAGLVIAQRMDGAPALTADGAGEREILYWYDPMVPNERYPGPGKSSMNMDTIPKYADEGETAPPPASGSIRR